jgi:hypothetical protein
MKPTKVNILDYQKIVESYHGESDRAAALLAGSFVEHYLAEYLKTCCLVSDPDIDELFHGFGPMATFAQRISIAYAIGAIDTGMRDDLRAIKDIRNHFAHHPTEAKFTDAILDKPFNKLSISHDPKFNPAGDKPLTDRRLIYLFGIAWFVIQAHNAMAKKQQVTNEPT